MSITAHFEQARAEQPRGVRRTLRLEARGETAAGATTVLVHNISTTGLLLESDAELAAHEPIVIELPHAGTTEARVIWTSGRLIGCQFEAPISAAALSAAQLRGAVGAQVDVAARPETAPTEEFAARIQRLRKHRGLTLSQVAARLGVSKPTVWAWEQGRSRPVDNRIAALAETLGVSADELLGDPGRSDALDELIARSRERIASAAGTSPGRIRIMIEL